MLSKFKYLLPKTTLQQLYYALIHPSLLYGIIIWGSTYPNYLQKRSILQNKALRAIYGAHYCNSASPIYAKIKILKIVDLHKNEIAKFVHKQDTRFIQ